MDDSYKNLTNKLSSDVKKAKEKYANYLNIHFFELNFCSVHFGDVLIGLILKYKVELLKFIDEDSMKTITKEEEGGWMCFNGDMFHKILDFLFYNEVVNA